MTCTSSPYVVTQADADAGSVANTATAQGTPPTGPPVVTPPSRTTTPTPDPAPGLSLVKSAALTHDANGDELAGVDDEITYYFDLANTGNVRLKDVAVDDELLAEFDVTVTCPSTTLAPGEEMQCVSSAYVATRGDIDAGYVRNIATANGKTPPPPGTHTPGSVKTPPSVVDVPTDDPPGLLAFTGSNTAPYVAAGVLLLMVGLALVLVARRRREPQDT
jgi:LPXTG-motif cell wall-anchored protein